MGQAKNKTRPSMDLISSFFLPESRRQPFHSPNPAAAILYKNIHLASSPLPSPGDELLESDASPNRAASPAPRNRTTTIPYKHIRPIPSQ
jgi:hypothetical protein